MTPSKDAYLDLCQQNLRGFTHRGDQGKAHCPLHDDRNPSLLVNLDKGWATCLAGCVFHKGKNSGPLEKLFGSAGLEFPAELAFRPKKKTEPIATYRYRGADGSPVQEVLRYDTTDKDRKFRQKFWNPTAWDWVWKIAECPDFKPVLYRLPEILAAPADEPLWWCEGEKDANTGATLGVVTTTTAKGASNFGNFRRNCDRELLRKALAGRRVVLLPDQNDDQAGFHYARDVGSYLQKLKVECTVLLLPPPPNQDMPHGYDLTDAVNLGVVTTAQTLRQLAEQAPSFASWLEQTPAKPSEKPAPAEAKLTVATTARVKPEDIDKGTIHNLSLPILDVGAPPPVLVQTALEALRAANAKNSRFFWRPAGLSYCCLTSDAPKVHLLDKHGLRARLDEAANFVTVKQARQLTEVTSVNAPMWVADALHSKTKEELGFAELSRIVSVPILVGQGTLLAEPGFHPHHSIAYCPAPELTIPAICPAPDAAEVDQAKRILLEDLLGDFRFASQADRANALGALILAPFVRELMDVAPLVMVEASTPATGKSLLVDACLTPFFGPARTGLSLITEFHGDEIGKVLGAALLDSPSVIQMDNLNSRLDSGTLAAFLTAPHLKIRILGTSTMANVRNQAVWVGTGNNPVYSDEISRRVVSIRLEAEVERPENRSGFRHPDLLGWCHQNRSQLVWAALTLVQHWVACGKPRSGLILGSFQRWTDVIGGILACADIPGFLGNRGQAQERSNQDRQEWSAFVSAWSSEFGATPRSATELCQIVRRLQVPANVFVKPNEQGQLTALGMALKKQVGRIFGGHRIERAPYQHGVAHYQLSLAPAETIVAPSSRTSRVDLDRRSTQGPPAQNRITIHSVGPIGPLGPFLGKGIEHIQIEQTHAHENTCVNNRDGWLEVPKVHPDHPLVPEDAYTQGLSEAKDLGWTLDPEVLAPSDELEIEVEL